MEYTDLLDKIEDLQKQNFYLKKKIHNLTIKLENNDQILKNTRLKNDNLIKKLKEVEEKLKKAYVDIYQEKYNYKELLNVCLYISWE